MIFYMNLYMVVYMNLYNSTDLFYTTKQNDLLIIVPFGANIKRRQNFLAPNFLQRKKIELSPHIIWSKFMKNWMV